MEVVRPPAKGGVHTSYNIFQWYRCAFTSGQLRYTLLDFCKRFRCRADMRITFSRLQSLAHPYFKTQEDEAFLPCINDAGLALVKREVKTIQHVPYRCQRRVYFASAQHHEVVRIADDVCLQFPAQLMFVPDPIQQVQVAVGQQRGDHATLRRTFAVGFAAAYILPGAVLVLANDRRFEP